MKCSKIANSYKMAGSIENGKKKHNIYISVEMIVLQANGKCILRKDVIWYNTGGMTQNMQIKGTLLRKRL